MDQTLAFDDLEVGQMDFSEAMREVAQGGRVRRESWPEGVWLFLNDTLRMRKPEGTFNLIVSDGDMLATDWVTC